MSKSQNRRSLSGDVRDDRHVSLSDDQASYQDRTMTNNQGMVGDRSYLDESMTPIVTPMKQNQARMLTQSARPFSPSERLSNHLFVDNDSEMIQLNQRRTITEVYGTKAKHIVERLRTELGEKDLKVKVSFSCYLIQQRQQSGVFLLLNIAEIANCSFFYLSIQRLRQEKLGLLLKCFTEMSNLLDILKDLNLPNEHANPLEALAQNFRQRINKLTDKPLTAKVLENTEGTDSDVLKLTGRIQQVFESSRLKNLRQPSSSMQVNVPLQDSSARFERISVPSPQFALQESKSQSSPSSS